MPDQDSTSPPFYQQNVSLAAISQAPEAEEERTPPYAPSPPEGAVHAPISHIAPDGGYGWLIVAAAFLVNGIIYGLQTSFGVFQKAYTTLPDAFPQVSQSQVALILAVQAASCPLSGIVTGRSADVYGYRLMAAMGALLLPAGLVIASFASEVWQLILTQGLLCGVGAGFIYYPTLAVLTQYFDKRRGVAVGIAVAGSGIGGTILSPITAALIPQTGWRWSLRIIGLACLTILVGVVIAMKPLLPAKAKGLDFTVFKDGNFKKLYCVGMLMQLGYAVPYVYLPKHASSIGLTDTDGATMLLITNACSAVGRVVLGHVADKFGQINILILTQLLSASAQLVIWPLARNYAGLVVFSVVYGSFSGSFFTIFTLVTAGLYGETRMATIAGLLFSSYAIGSLGGAPIAGALVGDGTSYLPAMLFGGFSMATAMGFALWTRVSNWGWNLRKK